MAKALKSIFDRTRIRRLALRLNAEHQEFDPNAFEVRVYQTGWGDKTLMQRVAHLSACMQAELDLPYQESLKVLEAVEADFSGLFHLIFPDYVSRYGLDCFEPSMRALGRFTAASTSEYAIRPFLQGFPEQTLRQLSAWSRSDDLHLRRLASEAVRPRLPWAKHLPWIGENPERVLPIIETLKADQSPYVRKSVANLLNDLSKYQAEWVLSLFEAWRSENRALPKETEWIMKHALRTLLKQGDVRALGLMGYAKPDNKMLKHWRCDTQVRMGDSLNFSVELHAFNDNLGKIRLEYALTFKRKRADGHRKVFKLAEGDYAQTHKSFAKQFRFDRLSTRRYYPGSHAIELLANGVMLAACEFELLEAEPGADALD